MHLHLLKYTKIFYQHYKIGRRYHTVVCNTGKNYFICSAPFNHFIHTFMESNNMAEEIYGVTQRTLLKKLNEFAPTHLAESWDNVGLLVSPSELKPIKKIFLTNDLTEAVVDEAIQIQADFIISYHPPIFVPFKSLTQKNWKERIIVKCIENKIAVYSPHTSFDSVGGGVNDWMASAFDNESVNPLNSSTQPIMYTHRLEMTFPEGASAISEFEAKLKQCVLDCRETVCDMKTLSHDNLKVSISCTQQGIPEVIKIFNDVVTDADSGNVEIVKHEQIPLPNCGAGRLCILKHSIPLAKVIESVKLHIKIPHVRVAVVPGKNLDSYVGTIAICVGSGSSVLRGIEADVYLTGEMLHHDVLDAVHKGHHVILCNHSDSERGFLIPFAQKLVNALGGNVEVVVSKEDKDPLVTV